MTKNPRFDPDALQRRLAARDTRELAIDGYAPSAVLVTILRGADQDQLLFTRRTEQVEHHKGQISFPGGRQDPGESLRQTALRETHEEVGIKPADIRIVGQLDDTWTPTRYLIRPFVGLVTYPYDFAVNRAEIDDLIVVPMARALCPDRYEECEMHHEGRSAVVPYFHIDGTIIWGATARILQQFLRLAYDREDVPCVGS